MKFILTKIPFIHKNFRDLKMELKVVFGSHFLTAISCFLPWVSYEPLYGESYFDNAFNGPIKLIGFLIFLISLVIIIIFVDKLLKTKKIKLPISENIIFIFAGFQQIILIICAWSVLLFLGGGFNSLQTRFGIIFSLLFQIFGLVSAYLLTRDKKKEAVISFFHQAEKKLDQGTQSLFGENKTKNPAKK